MSVPFERAAFAPLFFFCAAFLGGCATDAPPTRSGNAKAAPAARYNLSGYSAAFKQGYADACGSPQRRSEERYKSDTDYQMGWNDGRSLCRK
jgi:hypothetical protein